MKRFLENNNFNKIVLVSGDGDYTKITKHLATKRDLVVISKQSPLNI